MFKFPRRPKEEYSSNKNYQQIQHPIFFPFTRLNVPIIRVHTEHTRHQPPTENLPLPPRFKMHSTRPAASVDVLSQEQLWIPLWTAALKSQNTHPSASDLVKETARRKSSSTWEQSRNGNAQNIPLRYFCWRLLWYLIQQQGTLTHATIDLNQKSWLTYKRRKGISFCMSAGRGYE